MELAQHLTLKYLQEHLPIYFIKLIGGKQFTQGMETIFRILQYPRLNKQLAYVYIDLIARKLFPTEDELDMEV